MHREAGGDDYPLRKPNADGWSQRRYEERAQNTWERNASDAAEQVARLARRVDARLVVAAGDQRALTLFQQVLRPTSPNGSRSSRAAGRRTVPRTCSRSRRGSPSSWP